MFNKLIFRVFGTVLFFLLNSDQQALADLQSITREIYNENGVVHVDDTLHYSEELTSSSSELWDILHDLQKNGENSTNLNRLVGRLLRDEDLIVKTQQSRIVGKYVELHIYSEVKFVANKPAKIHFVSKMGGETVEANTFPSDPQEYMGGRVKNEMLIYRSGNSIVLWFPDSKVDYTDMSNLEAVEAFFDRAPVKAAFGFKDDELFACRIKGPNPTVLFNWDWSQKNPNPDITFLRQLNNSHSGLSENEFISLCTNMKIAKGGYYPIFPVEK